MLHLHTFHVRSSRVEILFYSTSKQEELTVDFTLFKCFEFSLESVEWERMCQFPWKPTEISIQFKCMAIKSCTFVLYAYTNWHEVESEAKTMVYYKLNWVRALKTNCLTANFTLNLKHCWKPSFLCLNKKNFYYFICRSCTSYFVICEPWQIVSCGLKGVSPLQ